ERSAEGGSFVALMVRPAEAAASGAEVAATAAPEADEAVSLEPAQPASRNAVASAARTRCMARHGRGTHLNLRSILPGGPGRTGVEATSAYLPFFAFLAAGFLAGFAALAFLAGAFLAAGLAAGGARGAAAGAEGATGAGAGAASATSVKSMEAGA